MPRNAVSSRPFSLSLIVLVGALVTGGVSEAQDAAAAGHHHEAGAGQGAKPPKPPKRKTLPVHHASHEASGADHEGMPETHHEGMPGMGGHGHDGAHDMQMKGFLGPYPITREGSGTSWLPD